MSGGAGAAASASLTALLFVVCGSQLVIPNRRNGKASRKLLQHQASVRSTCCVGDRASSQHQIAVRGIKNLGNTCFLNAVLQSLGSLPVFREYLEALSPEPHPLRDGDSFAEELLEVMKNLKPRTPPLTPIVPTKLRTLLRDRVDIFGKEDQQDAQELFQLVMRLLGEEAAKCQKDRDKNRRVLPEIGGSEGLQGLTHLTAKSDSGDANTNDSPENPLLGSLMYLRDCRECPEKWRRMERFVDMSLTLPEARNHHIAGPGCPPVKLETILEEYTQRQLVEDVDCPRCAFISSSDAYEEAVKPKRVRTDLQILLASPPKTLCLHFPRRHHSPTGSEVKLKQRVIFPICLNMAPFCYTGGCHKDSIGMSTSFTTTTTPSTSLPQLMLGRTAKSPAGVGGRSEVLFSTSPPDPSPALAKALQSPPSHPSAKHALVGGNADGGSEAAVRKDLNGLPSGGSSAGGSSVSGSSDGRESTDGSVSGLEAGMEYDLRAVIVHRGGADSGHYTAFRKLDANEEAMDMPTEVEQKAPRGQGGGRGSWAGEEWVYISDEDVERVSEKRVLNSEAYMLFYRQRISEACNQNLS